MWGFFSGALVAVAGAIFALLRRYAAPSVPLVVKAATTYAWLVAFIVLVGPRGRMRCGGKRHGRARCGCGRARCSSGPASTHSASARAAAPRCSRRRRPPRPALSSCQVLVPIDVYATLTKLADNAVVDTMWQVCYWSTQILTWLVLPFFQVYADAGDFTAGARCVTSLKVGRGVRAPA
jgi:hypothetical protein